MKRVLDSGAYTWYNQRRKAHKGGKLDWSDYKSQEFWDFVNSYAEFVKKWGYLFEFYVTVDSVRNPKISWQVTKYLEQEHGLNPMPVVHYGTGEKWLEKYLNAGYKYIGFGGKIERQDYFPWADRVWNIVCDNPNRMPLIKVHGFSVTSAQICTRYPWYSVDSTSSKKNGYFGQVLVPQRKGGQLDYKLPFVNVFTDLISPYTKRNGDSKGRHYLHLSKPEKEHFHYWLDVINAPFGEKSKSGKILELGVSNDKQERVAANIKYFLWLQSQIPKWPWPWQRTIPHRTKLEELLK